MSGLESELLVPALYKGILLLGPTGSGKTPLGQLLAHRGIWGRRCVHFDFGYWLRWIASDHSSEAPPPQPSSFLPECSQASQTSVASETDRTRLPEQAYSLCSEYFTREERQFIQQVLLSGALLEDKDFWLAVKILKYFLVLEGLAEPEVLRQPQSQPLKKPKDFSTEPLIVLNGLPRHVGQAEAMKSWVDVQAVVYLDCPAEVVLERIRSNIGGDRQGRTDDDLQCVQAKLATYQARTQPLIAYYQSRGVPIVRLPVTTTITPAETWQELQRKNPW
ncbi:MAG: nucleoside monophosphate kinase [Thermoguttaceae bacterium]|nr:nucleoside monophosphate kinase [Thermoguttaceae bacterium]MDW8037053.1 nucleoside monophosphate kinase [Thermoguttaceae bacterium]